MSKHIRKVLGLLQHRKQIQLIPPPHQQPTSRTPEEWSIYWKAQGQPWRTEPEIDKKRQEELAQRRTIVPDIESGIYPFKGMKLSRADVEWLLATHENGRGPVDWSDESQREREGLDLRGADLSKVDLRKLPLARIRGGLEKDEWRKTTEKQREMAAVRMEEADLRATHLEGAFLRFAHLEGTDLRYSFLERAHLRGAYLMRTKLCDAYLERTRLEGAILSDERHIGPYLADTKWNDCNLALAKWSQVIILGDEHEARQKKHDGVMKNKVTRLKEYHAAVRANRQLAVALQGQGLNEEAARFAYRAHVLQKSILWFQMTQQRVPFRERMQALGAWLFSWFLFLLAGYGYKPIRSVLAYLVIIFGFMGLYLLNAHFIAPHLTWDEALVLSVSSFHGRGFFTQNVTLGDTYARLAAVEAIVGLFIEISFIATFTQRFFGK